MNRKYIAWFLVAVFSIHVFVLVPVSQSYLLGADLGRMLFRSVAPSAVAAAGSTTSLVLGIPIAIGVAYVIYKPEALQAARDWLSSHLGNGVMPSGGGLYTVLLNGTPHTCRIAWNTSFAPNQWVTANEAGTGWAAPNFFSSNYDTGAEACRAAFAQYWGGSGTAGAWGSSGSVSPPTSVTDYGSLMAAGAPTFPPGSIMGSPGASRALTGADYGIQVSWMDDAQVGALLSGLGATTIDPATGAQADYEGVTPNDNTITVGDSKSIGLLQSILNYMTNLVGIKTDTTAIKAGVDCVAMGMSSVSVAIQGQSAKLDNIAAIGNMQSVKLDNITTGLGMLPDRILTATGESLVPAGSISARWTEVKTIASTKFPFGVASGLVPVVPSVSNSYDFGSLQLAPTVSIPINPRVVFPGLFSWIRSALVLLIWCGMILACLKKVDAL